MQNATTQKLLSRTEAAERLGVKVATLEMWAHLGRPKLPYIKVGNAARYRETDLEAFLMSRTATSAAEHAAALS